MPDLPSYRELPVRPDLPPGSSWGVWGDGDVFGCLNLLTPERVLAGRECVVDGTLFPLNLELELPGPPLFDRAAFRHEVLDHAGTPIVGHDELLHDWNTQSSSQWDGFRHIRHPEHGFYGGVEDAEHGVHHWARRGIAGRGVVCDVDGYRPIDHTASDQITPDDVRGALDAQGVVVEAGDVLLLHTGWVGWYRSLDDAGRRALAKQRRPSSPGLRAGDDMLALLWDLHIAAIGADNPAVEAWPPEGTFMHFSLLPLLGLPLGELWDISPLAEACRADRRWTCLFVSAPLNLAHGVASPPNATAIR